jgi:phosphatidylglycerol:prolipoprotein diacylglycerol transferase
MLSYPVIDPVAVELGPLSIRWYGLMYVLAFALAWLLGRRRIKSSAPPLTLKEFEDLLFWLICGLLIGARVGYVLFYQFTYFLEHPFSLFAVWQGGMSFHGGLIGVLAAAWGYAARHEKHLFAVTDFIAPLAPLGLGAGRIGNFINAELWGRPSDLPWAMIFPGPEAGNVSRHPSQLYEALLEGGVLFLILWLYSKRNPSEKAVSGLFLFGYGVFRFAVEFARQPDPHLGLIGLGWLSMGQILSLPMILAGLLLFYFAYRPVNPPK